MSSIGPRSAAGCRNRCGLRAYARCSGTYSRKEQKLQFDALAAHRQQRLGAIGDVERLENGGDVDLHRALGEAQQIGNLAIGLALSQQFKDANLSTRQPEAVDDRAAATTAFAIAQLGRQID